MSVAGNLTEVVIEEHHLRTRIPWLDRYRERWDRWDDAISTGRSDALAMFEEMRGQDPTRAKAVNDESWQRILTFATCRVIFEADGAEQSAALEEMYAKRLKDSMAHFLYRYDVSDSGEIEVNTIDESSQRGIEVHIRR